MKRRFYVINMGACWSLSKDFYLKLLQNGVQNQIKDLDLQKYEARTIKKSPPKAKPIDVTDFELEHYQQELEHFLKTGEQTGFNAADFISVFFDD
jgi:hypothetical protein